MMTLTQILEDYQALHLSSVIDHDRFNQYAIVHHSSTIEGSTLTENETRLLLEEGVTPKGKPLEHSLMVKDHYDALQFALEAAKLKKLPDITFIQAINARVMKSTGSIYQTIFGEIDGTKGMFRKGNVSAGGSYFVGFEKVEAYTKKLVSNLESGLQNASGTEEKLNLSFTMHYDLVTIHPFYDGNGRTSRLLMNFVQAYFNLPLAIVLLEDKKEYFDALQQTRKNEDLGIFLEFMKAGYRKFLLTEINQYKQDMSRTLPETKNTGNDRGYPYFFKIRFA